MNSARKIDQTFINQFFVRGHMIPASHAVLYKQPQLRTGKAQQ